MSSFTERLIVSKLDKKFWTVERKFTYHVGDEDSIEFITVPFGFITDFASVPRIFWSVLPPDGEYTQAAVLHDYMYNEKLYERKICDDIFLEAMTVLKVPGWKRRIIYYAVRMFGGFCF